MSGQPRTPDRGKQQQRGSSEGAAPHAPQHPLTQPATERSRDEPGNASKQRAATHRGHRRAPLSALPRAVAGRTGGGARPAGRRAAGPARARRAKAGWEAREGSEGTLPGSPRGEAPSATEGDRDRAAQASRARGRLSRR